MIDTGDPLRKHGDPTMSGTQNRRPTHFARERKGSHPLSRGAFLRLAGALLCAAFVVSCAAPSIRRHKQPLTDSEAIGTLVDPVALTRETRVVLRESRQALAYRTDPATTIAELHANLGRDSSPTERLALAEMCSDTGDRLVSKDPLAAVGHHLAAAEVTYASARASAGRHTDDLLLAAYNYSAGRVAEILYDAGHSSTRTATIEGPWKSYRLRWKTSGSDVIDPEFYDDIENADTIELRNYEMDHIRQEGIGAAMIVHRQGTPERRKVNPFLSPIGMTVPVNALLDYQGSGGSVELRLTDLLLREHLVVQGRRLPLSSDLSVPIAVQVDYDPERDEGFRAMMHPDDYIDRTGLYQLEPFRPNQIPVVFVHGLMSVPETWVPMINQLRSDPAIRENYQLMVFRYPSGFPITYNMATLRKQLEAFRRHRDPHYRNPNMSRLVVTGHSMGGILSNTVIRGSGTVFSDFLFDRPIDQVTDLDPEQKAAIKDLLIFEANPDITRAICVAAPHRGSDFATGGVGALGRALISFPRQAIMSRPLDLQNIEGMTEEGKELLSKVPDSVGSLRPDAPVLKAILANPVRSGTVVHTIAGRDKPEQPLEESSDTVVPYTSAHLDEAVSELVVDDVTHNTILDSEVAIEEVRRILYLHAGLGRP